MISTSHFDLFFTGASDEAAATARSGCTSASPMTGAASGTSTAPSPEPSLPARSKSFFLSHHRSTIAAITSTTPAHFHALTFSPYTTTESTTGTDTQRLSTSQLVEILPN